MPPLLILWIVLIVLSIPPVTTMCNAISRFSQNALTGHPMLRGYAFIIMLGVFFVGTVVVPVLLTVIIGGILNIHMPSKGG